MVFDDHDVAGEDLAELGRLVEIVRRLRRECPWDAGQTHRSLVQYLIEETYETVEAIEEEDRDHLREELGDLLFEVILHATIAAEESTGFSLADVATQVTDKLIRRHPHVFAGDQLPDDLDRAWEGRKAAEKGRSSVLEGIPVQMSAVARAAKIISRARARDVPLALADEPISAEEFSSQVMEWVARAQSAGIDPEQAIRDSVRELERRVAAAEAG